MGKGGYTIIDLKGYDLVNEKEIKGIYKKLQSIKGKEVKIVNFKCDDLVAEYLSTSIHYFENRIVITLLVDNDVVSSANLYVEENDIVSCSYA